jgi:hypothetical protein
VAVRACTLPNRRHRHASGVPDRPLRIILTAALDRETGRHRVGWHEAKRLGAIDSSGGRLHGREWRHDRARQRRAGTRTELQLRLDSPDHRRGRDGADRARPWSFADLSPRQTDRPPRPQTPADANLGIGGGVEVRMVASRWSRVRAPRRWHRGLSRRRLSVFFLLLGFGLDRQGRSSILDRATGSASTDLSIVRRRAFGAPLAPLVIIPVPSETIAARRSTSDRADHPALTGIAFEEETETTPGSLEAATRS